MAPHAPESTAHAPWSSGLYVEYEHNSATDLVQFDQFLSDKGVRPYHKELVIWAPDYDDPQFTSYISAELFGINNDHLLDSKGLTSEEKRRYRAERLTMYPIKYVALAWSILNATLLWSLIAYKIYNDGALAFYHFFTNWMLTVNALFFTGDIISYLDPTGRLQRFWLLAYLWPYFGNVSAVFVLVFPLLGLNPNIMIETASQVGWSTTFIGERIVHVLPFFDALMWFVLRCEDIVDVLSTFKWDTTRNKCYFLLYLLVTVLCCNLIILCYCVSYDYEKIYGVQVSGVVAFFGIQIIYCIFVLFPIVVLSPVGRYLRKAAYRRDYHPIEITLSTIRGANTPKKDKHKDDQDMDDEEDDGPYIELIIPQGTILGFSKSLKESSKTIPERFLDTMHALCWA